MAFKNLLGHAILSRLHLRSASSTVVTRTRSTENYRFPKWQTTFLCHSWFSSVTGYDSPLLPDMIFLCYRIWFPSVTGYDIQLTAQVFWRLLCSSGILEFVRGPLLLVSVHSYWSCLVWSSGVVWFIDFLRLKIWRTFLSFWIGISSQSKVFLFYQTVLYWFFSLFMKSYL